MATNGSLALARFEDIFSASGAPADGEHIVRIPLAELFPPEYHPFLVRDDEAMTHLVESVRQYGVLVPGIARPRAGGYELIAGNRRKRACELVGISELPVIIREMDDDEAVIALVDTNFEQRETLLPSEKAWAYRLKLEAMNHRGAKSDIPGQLSVDVLCAQTGDSKNQIFRFVRLTELAPALADKVDARKLAFNPAVELSFLARTEQGMVVDCMAKYQIKPSLSQAQRMKKASQEGGLTPQLIESILSEPKKAPVENNSTVTSYRRFFPKGYSPEQMDTVIIELLTGWQSEQSKTQ